MAKLNKATSQIRFAMSAGGLVNHWFLVWLKGTESFTMRGGRLPTQSRRSRVGHERCQNFLHPPSGTPSPERPLATQTGPSRSFAPSSVLEDLSRERKHPLQRRFRSCPSQLQRNLGALDWWSVRLRAESNPAPRARVPGPVAES